MSHALSEPSGFTSALTTSESSVPSAGRPPSTYTRLPAAVAASWVRAEGSGVTVANEPATRDTSASAVGPVLPPMTKQCGPAQAVACPARAIGIAAPATNGCSPTRVGVRRIESTVMSRPPSLVP